MSLKNAKERCLEDLRQRILSTELAPGAALDEARLAEQYGISRTPMREVLQRLTGAGFAVFEDNRGAKVSPMDIATLRMFFQTAPLVYANTARLAAEHRTEVQLAELRTVQRRFVTSQQTLDPGQAALANHRFHEVIGEMAHNPYLQPALGRMLIDHTRLSQTFYRPRNAAERAAVREAQAQHDQMIDAIATRDAARACDLTLAHWDLSRDQIERFVQPEPLPVDMPGEDVSNAV